MSNATHSNPPVIVRLKCGLGNQMFQYAAGRAMSLALGSPLLLDVAKFRTDPARRYGLGVFRLKPQFITGARRLAVSLLDRVPIRAVPMSLISAVHGRKAAMIVDDGMSYTPLPSKPGLWLLDGYFQSENYFASHAELIRSEFTFQAPLDGPNAALAERIRDCAAVAVHVRRGDYVTNAQYNAHHGLCGVEYFSRAARIILDAQPDARFFAFSEDPDWVEQNLKLGAPLEVVRGNAGKADHVDLQLMSMCKHFVMSNSSFSWWAGWLSNHPDKRIVAPKRWVNDPALNERFTLPPSWTRI